MSSTPPEPDPENTPDLEPGGGVKPGSTPPDAPQTSGLSEPSTVKRFPVTGIAAVVAVALVVIIFVIAAVAILA